MEKHLGFLYIQWSFFVQILGFSNSTTVVSLVNTSTQWVVFYGKYTVLLDDSVCHIFDAKLPRQKRTHPPAHLVPVLQWIGTLIYYCTPGSTCSIFS